MDEIEAMMNNLTMPGPQGYDNNVNNIMGDVSNILNDIEAQHNPLDQLENSLDSLLDPNSMI